MSYSIYEQQKINAARRRALADQLAARAMQPQGSEVAPGGLVVPKGIEGLAVPLITAWMARRRGRKADAMDAAAEKEHDTAVTGALEQYRKSVPDEDVGAESYNRIMAAPEGELAEPTYGRSESQYNLMSEMMPRDQVAQFMIQQQMAADAPYTLPAGARRMVGSRVIGEAPAAPRAPEPLENVIGRDGKPTKVRRSQAEGMEPAFPPDNAVVQTVDQNGNPVYTPRPQSAGQQAYRTPPKPPISAKEAQTARAKMVTVDLLKQQLGELRSAFAEVQQENKNSRFGGSTGPLAGMKPTKAGERFDAAVASMGQLVMGLTRTPGIGASSDFESKLAVAPMPSRLKFHDSTIEQQITNLEMLITGIENGYSDMLAPPEGAQPEQPAPSAAPPMRQPGQPQRVDPRTLPGFDQLSPEDQAELVQRMAQQ